MHNALLMLFSLIKNLHYALTKGQNTSCSISIERTKRIASRWIE